MKGASRAATGLAVACLVFCSWNAASAAERGIRGAAPLATESISGSDLAFSVNGHFDRAIVSVVGPEGDGSKSVFEAGELISVEVEREEGGLLDGLYRYELRLIDRLGSPLERVQGGIFYVEAGALVSRADKRSQLESVRESLEAAGGSSPRTVPEGGLEYHDNAVQVKDITDDGTTYLALQMSPGGAGPTFWDVFADNGNLNLDYEHVTEFTFTPESDFGIGTSNPTNNIHMFPPIEGSIYTGLRRSPEIYMYAYSSSFLGDFRRGWEVGANTGVFWIKDKGDDGSGNEFPLRILAGATTDSIRISSTGTDFKGDLKVPDGAVTTEELHLASSRAWKDEIEPIDVGDVLQRLSAVPVSEWSFKDDAEGVRHIGPMAEDFQEAFELEGKESDHLSVTDVQGVAIAAIQALDQQVRELREERDRERSESAELRRRLEVLERQLLEP